MPDTATMKFNHAQSFQPLIPASVLAPPDMIVVGHAGFTAINRNIYAALVALGWRLELVIPQYLPGLDSRQADPKRVEDPPIHWVQVKGKTNQRFWSFEGLQTILEIRKPRAIYLEGDPASVLAIHLARWARRNEVPLLCYTIENRAVPHNSWVNW